MTKRPIEQWNPAINKRADTAGISIRRIGKEVLQETCNNVAFLRRTFPDRPVAIESQWPANLRIDEHSTAQVRGARRHCVEQPVTLRIGVIDTHSGDGSS